MNNFLLTISIPTYSRPKYLKKCLDSLLTSSQQLSDSDLSKIQVCVFDNSDNDSSSSIICKNKIYSKINLTYKKNDFNIGSDKNILQSFLTPKSKYVAIMSDDDFVEIDYFKDLLEIIYATNPDIVFLKAYGMTGEKDIFSPFRIAKQIKFTSPTALLFDRMIQVGFVSTSVLRRDKIDDTFTRECIGTNLIQVGACFSVMSSMDHAIYSSKNLVRVTRNNSGGYSPIVVFYLKFFDLMHKFNYFGMSKNQLFSFKNKLLLTFYSRNFAQYFRAKEAGLSGSDLHVLNEAFKDNYLYRFLMRKLFIDSNKFSYLMLTFIFTLSNLIYYPIRFFDFFNHFINYLLKVLFNIIKKYT